MSFGSIVSTFINHLLWKNVLGTVTRSFSTTTTRWGPDSREKRAGHIELSDKVEGEHGTFAASPSSFEFVDENLMERVIDGMRFKDIPALYIVCTRNNTKVTLMDSERRRVATKSAGTEGFKNCRKGTTVAAQAVANRVLTIANDNEINTVRMVFRGLGPGRNAAYKVFEMSNLNIVSLSDRTEAVEPWVKRPRKAKRL